MVRRFRRRRSYASRSYRCQWNNWTLRIPYSSATETFHTMCCRNSYGAAASLQTGNYPNPSVVVCRKVILHITEVSRTITYSPLFVYIQYVPEGYTPQDINITQIDGLNVDDVQNNGLLHGRAVYNWGGQTSFRFRINRNLGSGDQIVASLHCPRYVDEPQFYVQFSVKYSNA